MKLVEETRIYEIPLEESLEFETVGGMVDAYSDSLIKVGFFLLNWRSDPDSPNIIATFRKSK